MARKRLFFSCIVWMALSGVGTALWGQSPGFAYVANSRSNDVSAFRIDTTGLLIPVLGSPFTAGQNPSMVAVDPSTHFAYVANGGSNDISAYTIDATTGALTPVSGSPFAAGRSPLFVAVDATGHFAYVTNHDDNNVSAYTIDPVTGALTPVPGSPFAAEQFPVGLAVDPTGHFAYVANCGIRGCTFGTGGNVSAYTINATTGALTAVPGSPFPAGQAPIELAVDPTGRFTYVVNLTSNNVSAYKIDTNSGALTPVLGSPFPAGDGSHAVAVEPTGHFLYAVNIRSSSVSAYTMDATTGALTPVPGSPFPTGPAGSAPRSVAADSTGQFLYAVNCGSLCGGTGFGDASAQYRINTQTGALSVLFTTGQSPAGVTTAAPPPVP